MILQEQQSASNRFNSAPFFTIQDLALMLLALCVDHLGACRNCDIIYEKNFGYVMLYPDHRGKSKALLLEAHDFIEAELEARELGYNPDWCEQ